MSSDLLALEAKPRNLIDSLIEARNLSSIPNEDFPNKELEQNSNKERVDGTIDTWLKAIHSNTTFNRLVDGVSLSAVSALSLSAIFNKHFFNIPENLSKKIYRIGDIANKIFQTLNSVKNIAKLVPNKDYINALGHLSDFFLPFITKMEDFYLSRGLSLGLYGGAQALNIIGNKANFQSDTDYFQHVKDGLRKTYKNFFKTEGSLVDRIFDHQKGMIGIFASSLCLSGFALWKPLEAILGKPGRMISAFLRDTGGFCVALEAMKPGHMVTGKIFYGLSGYSQFLGALFNLLAESVLHKYKDVCDPLSFAFSNLGRWFLSISNSREESGLRN